MTSAHDCTRGKEIGIKPWYQTREEAAADAARLQAHVNDPCCLYHAALALPTEARPDAL